MTEFPIFPVNNLASFLQSLQELEKGAIRHFCPGNISEFGEDGRWSPKHSFKRRKPLPVRNTLGPEQGNGRRLPSLLRFP